MLCTSFICLPDAVDTHLVLIYVQGRETFLHDCIPPKKKLTFAGM